MRTLYKGWICTILGILMLSIVGCGQTEPSSGIVKNDANIDSGENDSSADSDVNIDNSPTASAADTTESIESDDTQLSPEESNAKESYEHWDAYCNNAALDLTPMVGDFMTLDPEPEDAFPYISSPDGDVFGFYDDLTDGCSVWCSIDYESYVNDISASSTLAPQGNNSYDATNLGNRSRKDAWVEGVDGYGIGESVTIVRKYSHGGDAANFQEHGYDSFFFPNLCIVNGMAKNEKAWKNNSRVKSLKLYFNDEFVTTLEIEDSMKPQFISLSSLHLSARDSEESTFRFEIADVYPGDKYDDTALTGIEIEVFTENH